MKFHSNLCFSLRSSSLFSVMSTTIFVLFSKRTNQSNLNQPIYIHTELEGHLSWSRCRYALPNLIRNFFPIYNIFEIVILIVATLKIN